MGDADPLPEPAWRFGPILARHAAQLQAALDHGGNTHTLDDVRAALVAGEMHLWASDAAAVVTEFATFPRFKAVNYFLAAGNLADVLAVQAVVEPWAREHGCERAMLSGREGWARVLTAHGWTPRWELFGKGIG